MISGSGIRSRTHESWLWMLSIWCGETFAICVVDLSKRTLKSYREKWARQLVQAIGDIHSKGFVLGSFFGSWSPILTKGSDCIQFLRFRNIPFILDHCFGFSPRMYLYRV